MARPTSSVAFIDQVEQEAAEAEQRPFEDIYMLPIPMATYKALSSAAAKKGLSAAQLIGVAIKNALKE
jgi:hypothetical protein